MLTPSWAGVVQWGGWIPFAQERFRELKTKIKDARGRPHVKKMEEESLKHIRIKYGKEVDPNAEEDDGGGKPKAKRIVYDDSDDEFASFLGK